MKSYIVDSFTKDKFKGNPAAVCIVEALLDDVEMQKIASEFNLSETAFISIDSTLNHYSIRYFSPIQEIDLCGHATLASAKVLFEEAGLLEVDFTTAKGVELKCYANDDEIAMDFPIYYTTEAKCGQATLDALGIQELINCEYNLENNILLLEMKSVEDLRLLRPDFEALKRSHSSINGVAVTAASDDDFDFYSRYFWPWAGGNEDPVTGAIHTFLVSYWSKRLGKSTMKAFQASKRGGYLNLTILENERVRISSEAQIILKGELIV